MTRLKRWAGFTLIELMIVVAILATLASIAIPKFADMIQKAQEGATKGNMGMLRSAISIYYADMNGTFPSCTLNANSTIFTDALIPKYISAIPAVKSGIHPPTFNVYCDQAMVGGSVHDAQGWYYDGTFPNDSLFGTVWVACDHTDIIGNSWTSY